MVQEEKQTRDVGRRVHLVLSAGGVKCISYAGAISALVENGVEFASVSGSSAGSFIGAVLCSKVGLDGFKQAATALELSSLGAGKSWIPRLPLLTKPFAMYERSLVVDKFCEIVGGNPTFQEMKPKFATFGVDLRTHKIHVYSTDATKEMFVAKALTIATAAPFLFPIEEVEENALLDGAPIGTLRSGRRWRPPKSPFFW